MGRRERREQERKNRKNPQKEEQEINTKISGLALVKLVTVIVIILLVLYYILAVFVTKEIEIGKKDETTSEKAEVSNKILASNIFSQQEEEYYVYCYNFDSDEDLDAIDSAIASSNIAVYKVNTKEGLNSKYVSEEDNPNAKTLEELKVKSPTLLKISADQIVAYYNNKADILKALS